MTGMRNLIVIFNLILRPWELSHRGERQKLMVNSWEGMSVHVGAGGLVASSLLR